MNEEELKTYKLLYGTPIPKDLPWKRHPLDDLNGKREFIFPKKTSQEEIEKIRTEDGKQMDS